MHFKGELGYNRVMRLRHLFFFLAFVVIAVLVIVQIGQFQQLLDVIARINVWVLLGVLVLRYLY